MDNSKYLANAHNRDRNEWKSADGKNPVKMLYLKHNLDGNYMGANGSGDMQMKRDILFSEIAKLIVYRTDEVIYLLKKYGKRVPEQPTHGLLVKMISNELHKSQEFAKEIVVMIGGRKMSADAQSTDYAGMISNVSDLVGGIGNLFGGRKKKKAQAAADKAAAAKMRAEADLEKARAEAALKKATAGMGGDISSSIGLYIGIAVMGAALAGIGIWYFKFRKK